jgi:hypothetical protein
VGGCWRRAELTPAARLIDVRLTEAGAERPQIACSAPLTIELTYDVRHPLRRASVRVAIFELRGREIALLDSHAMTGRLESFAPGRVRIDCDLDHLPLQPTQYCLDISLRDGDDLVGAVSHATTFTIAAEDYYGTGALPGSGTVLLRGWWAVNAER